MIKEIKSNQNKYFKQGKSLKIKKYRDLLGQYLVEGIKLVEEAMISNIELLLVFISSNELNNERIKGLVRLSLERNVPIYVLEEEMFKELSMTRSSQGIIGIVKKKSYELEDFLYKETLDIIILNEVQDPGNLGTIIRTADACGFDCVLLSKACVDVFNDKTVRATMGSLFHIPIITNTDMDSLINILLEMGTNVIAADPYGDKASFDMRYSKKNAIIIGNESLGLPESLIKTANFRVKIPMVGKAESLNAAVAASILMYEVLKLNIKNEFL